MTGKFTGVLLASDYDNTLLNTEAARAPGAPTARLSERTKEALRYFMAEGGRFALATGRALASIEKFAGEIPMNCPAVICNGAALYDFARHTYLDRIFLDEEAGRRCQALLDGSPTTAVEAYPLENVIHAVRPNRYTKQHENLTLTSAQVDASLLEVPAPLTKLLFEDDHAVLLDLEARLLAQPWIDGCEVFFSAPTLLELTKKGANKGGMVRRLAERLGISFDHVYCAGDEANDLSMLAFAAEGFAPANCSQKVRESGATIVSDCDHDAVAEVIEILDRRYGRPSDA